MPDDTPYTLTRRDVLRRSASIIPTASLVGSASADQPTPSAAELTLEPADVPWKVDAYKLPFDLTDSLVFDQLITAAPRLAAGETAYVDYIRDEWPHSPHLPEVCNLVVVFDDPPERAFVISEIADWVAGEYEATLPDGLDPAKTVRGIPTGAQWLYEFPMADATLQNLISCQCIGETVFLTSHHAYDHQYNVDLVARQVDRRLRRQRRERIRSFRKPTDA